VKRIEWFFRIARLMVGRKMTLQAARTVVDAAMYEIGCIEGKVRAEIERNK